MRLYNALGGGWETTYPEAPPRAKRGTASTSRSATGTPATMPQAAATATPAHQPA
ncbi:hypothetical protein RAA17_00410 [Komagataeibacter rhaeticus]|nr:hypothetical protein [Komagataeibacter rhaeticus]